ncbi:GAF domain-containing protein [Pseudarthrobacter sp. fls2-241-R2A-127]|uniref:GAF domain-containing protein n=1 Tax=Pseudarthrobacter sp. fls2-241-R2A-127 TaxID=3040303 RepID=UPI0025533CE3|nr:GAF domain-containing protein [Pseudarthrobacter sp. fls2-241-R2A-127]
MAAEPSGQVGWGLLPVTPEPVFDNKDVEAFLREFTHDFMSDIKGEHRGIGWAATLFRLGQARTLAASTEQAREADREQCSFADGPLLEAMRTEAFVLVSDLSRDRRWPGYASAASGHGVQSMLSVPIMSEGGTSAAITFYAGVPHAFTSDDLVRIQGYARQLARALRLVFLMAERAEATAGFAVVQSSLVLVDLAVRSLTSEYGLSREAALLFLQTQALQHELDLRDAALNVVAPGVGRDRSGPPPSGLRQEAYDGVAELPRPSAAGRGFPTGKQPRRNAAVKTETPPPAEGRTA